MDEVKIVKNISTIKLEEKIPIYMSDRNQKSAKEILGKTKVHFEVQFLRNIKEKDELDTEERKSKHK